MTSSVSKFLVTYLVIITTATCIELPDIASVFRGFYGDNDQEANNADDTAKERVKRQDPGIGDESNLPYLIKAASLPKKPNSEEINDRYMPVLGNGQLATIVYDDFIFMNGLYNGFGDQSARAAIPAKIMSRIQIANEDVESRSTRKFHLNALEGYFMETIDCDFAWIEHKLYIHKYFIRLFVSDIYYRPKSGSFGGGKILLNYPEFNNSADITFGTETPYYFNHTYRISGHTNDAEDGGSTQVIHMFWMDAPKEIPISTRDEPGNYTFVMAVDRQESGARTEFDEALRILEGPSGHYKLFESHLNAWKNTWDQGYVEVEGGDLQLAKITTFSQFYLLSSLPTIDAFLPAQHSEFVHGIGRTSLGKGRGDKDYQGHVMWDNEMYILPAMIFFQPDLVKKTLRYRSEMDESARQIAESFGAEGYKYPFRSAVTGQEVSPSGCMECEYKKYYVSSGVSWIIRQYYSATRDRDFLFDEDYKACDITREIARFFASQSTYDPTTGRYTMGTMTGPDETYPFRKDNAYTMASASLAIHWAQYTACLCNNQEELPDEWIQMALYYDLPFDNVKRIHEQFSGFSEISNPVINQADTIMLTYPLNWNMSNDVMRNDLEYYESITHYRSPAMTWSFFTVGWKWIDDLPKMDSYFKKSYQDYLIHPFRAKLWPSASLLRNLLFTPTSAQDVTFLWI